MPQESLLNLTVEISPNLISKLGLKNLSKYCSGTFPGNVLSIKIIFIRVGHIKYAVKICIHDNDINF